MSEKILADFESRSLAGNNTGILLLHGFSSSPWEMRLLGDHLNKLGYSVEIPLLPGHGTSAEDLKKVTWQDWVRFSEEKLTEMRQKHENVFIAGISMGGTITANLASRHNVDGIILLAAGLFLNNRFAFLSHLIRQVKNIVVPKSAPDINNRAEVRSYKHLPVSAISELLKLFSHTKKIIPGIKCPTLIIYSEQDHVIRPESSRYYYNKISSKNKKLIKLQKSFHIITLDEEKEEVFNHAADFLRDIIRKN